MGNEILGCKIYIVFRWCVSSYALQQSIFGHGVLLMHGIKTIVAFITLISIVNFLPSFWVFLENLIYTFFYAEQIVCDMRKLHYTLNGGNGIVLVAFAQKLLFSLLVSFSVFGKHILSHVDSIVFCV